MTSLRSPRLLAVLLVAALAMLTGLTGCGGGDGGGSADKPSTSPYVRPTGSPFAVTITGPEVATAGASVTATITNTGRLPDAYLLQSDPVGAAGIAEPNVRLAPGETTDVTIQVLTVPVLIRVQSISGGSGNTQAELSIGSQ